MRISRVNSSPDEAKQVAKLPNVKRVSKSYLTYITLTEAIPLIKADSVWKLDADLNNCELSGKDGLTGKGVKIAIFDTGIDYTHPDLGGGFGPGYKIVDGYDVINDDNDPMDDKWSWNLKMH